MKWYYPVYALFLLLGSGLRETQALALPTLDLVTAGSFGTAAGPHSVSVLVDENDTNLYYAIPHHLAVVKDKDNPLFRMSVNPDGSGDIFLIAELQPHPNLEADFAGILLENPAAKLALLPLTTGTFKVSLQADDNIYEVISESTVVQNAGSQSHMPLHAKVSRDGMDRLRLISSTPAGSLLSFSFEFSFLTKQIGDSYDFKIHRNNLLKQIKADESFQAAIAKSMNLDQDWARQQVFRAIGFNFSNGKSIIPLNSLDQDEQYLYLATEVLQGVIPDLFAANRGSDWLQYSFLKKLYFMDPITAEEEVVVISRAPASTFVLAHAQAGGSLRGACIKHAQLIYDYAGTTSCAAMVPQGTEPPPSPPVFDPILF